MNREIKFRCWDPGAKEMYDPMPLIDFELLRLNAHALMQFTGLKDKNGKEIYEGDIVQWVYSRDTTGQDIVICTEVVEWEYQGFNVPSNKVIEVIGNRFENPDLLE